MANIVDRRSYDYENECTNENHSHDCNGDYTAEPYFSWRRCDCCGSTLGGNREDCIGYNPTTGKVQGDYSVCVDCIYYNEYGTLDDMTMMDMVDDTKDDEGWFNAGGQWFHPIHNPLHN